MNKFKQITLAAWLTFMGWRLEHTRKKLQREYLLGKQNDGKRMTKLRNRFNNQCDQWIVLENKMREKSEE